MTLHQPIGSIFGAAVIVAGWSLVVAEGVASSALIGFRSRHQTCRGAFGL